MYIAQESVDLIYLDPPFNSKKPYNLLHQTARGKKSDAQIQAFKDTWEWGLQAEQEYQQVLKSPYTDTAQFLKSFRQFLGETDTMAYLTMMAIRWIELHRVLKNTGSLYLHCDPAASHYLKILLDSVFGKENYRNEISWKRSPFSGSRKARAQQYPRSHDSLFFYTKSDVWTWNTPSKPYSEKYLKRFKFDNHDGRGLYRKTLLKTYSDETFERLKAENRLIPPQKAGARYSYKQYLSESSGNVQIDDFWDDINALNPMSQERLGYPTQKPLPLMERIIAASSNPGDVVLDPFCGCGTTVHAAQRLGRQWLGIDITHLAIALIEKRLHAAFPDVQYSVEGTPKDLEGAYNLAERDKYQFQWWACSLVQAQPYQNKKKGADGGIDGLIFIKDIVNDKPVDKEIIVSVKGGKKVDLAMIKELIATVDHRADTDIGLFVTLAEPTQPMITEAAKSGFYTAGNGKQYPRIQILTIEQLLTGTKQAEYMDFALGTETFKKAERENADDIQQGKLF